MKYFWHTWIQSRILTRFDTNLSYKGTTKINTLMFVKKLWIFRLKESKHFISGTALRKLHILSSWHHSKSSLDKIHKDLTKKKSLQILLELRHPRDVLFSKIRKIKCPYFKCEPQLPIWPSQKTKFSFSPQKNSKRLLPRKTCTQIFLVLSSCSKKKLHGTRYERTVHVQYKHNLCKITEEK